MYVYKYFDVLTWWRVNAGKYNELSVAATIVCGKPTHNAFQERVFNIGTHKDTRLRNRIKEDGFEMSILNAVNDEDLVSNEETIKIIGKDLERFALSKQREEEQKSIQLIRYLEKRSQEEDIIGNCNEDYENETDNIDDEEKSVASDNSSDDLLSDTNDDNYYQSMREMVITYLTKTYETNADDDMAENDAAIIIDNDKSVTKKTSI
jgi:hAT family C-terminal dimerisation region